MTLRAFLVKNDIYITGPVIVYWENYDEETKEADVNILLPTYQKLEVDQNDTFFFKENFLIPDGLKIRHTDIGNDVKATESLLELMAEKAELVLKKPYYYIYLPVFQEYVIDIYAPIEEGEES